ncbi:MAG: DUF3108 domain-containing protein [Oleiphilaceae bacterium]|nr:DUF3108 domain-containing protein [Oleiphilaceae bacterium]
MHDLRLRLTALLLLSLLLAPLAQANGDPDTHPHYQQDQQASSRENATDSDGDGGGTSASQTPSQERADDQTGEKSRYNGLKPVKLEPMEATYRAQLTRGISLSGEATRSLKKRDDGRWDYRFDVDSFIAKIRESAVLSYEDNRVIPHRYRYSLKGTFIKNRSNRYNFDWDNMTVLDLDKNRRQDISDYPQIQDQLTAQLQLWVDLKAGKKTMEYVIVDNGGTKDYQFEVLGEETIETENFGKVDTIRVWRIRDEDSPRSTHMWFAPEWNYLLVKLEQREEGGEDFDIHLQKADIQGQSIRP